MKSERHTRSGQQALDRLCPFPLTRCVVLCVLELVSKLARRHDSIAELRPPSKMLL